MAALTKTVYFSSGKEIFRQVHSKVLRLSPTVKCHRASFHCLQLNKVRKVTGSYQWQKNIHDSSKLNATVAFKLSDIGEGITEVTIKEWYVKVGDDVQQFDNICEVQSDKASVTITSRYDGRISKLYYNVDDIAIVGTPLIDIDTQEEHSVMGESEEPKMNMKNECNDSIQKDSNKVLTTPTVRRLAREHKVSLDLVPGTGKNGRILKEDILSYLEKLEEKVLSDNSSTDSSDDSSDDDCQETTKERREPITGIQKAMFKTMTTANNVPHFTYTDEVSVAQLVKLRAQMKNISGVKVTYLPFFIKAVSKCLLEYPVLNSSVDDKLGEIIYKPNHNIGVAVDTPDGLLVPNVKSVQQLNLLQIANELNILQKLGLSGRLRQNHLSGGTFTISNIGSIGGMYASPVILPPEVAIGAFGKIQIVPKFGKNGELIKDEIMCVSWAADHRIIDGATVAKFSNLWKEFLQSPHLLLF